MVWFGLLLILLVLYGLLMFVKFGDWGENVLLILGVWIVLFMVLWICIFLIGVYIKLICYVFVLFVCE